MQNSVNLFLDFFIRKTNRKTLFRNLLMEQHSYFVFKTAPQQLI